MEKQPLKKRGGSKKGRQQMNNLRKGKYRKAFIRCVKRTGKWRGKKVSLTDVYEGGYTRVLKRRS